MFVTFNFHDFEVIAKSAAEAGQAHLGIIVSYHQYADDEVGLFARALINLLEGRSAEDFESGYLVLPRPRTG